MATLKQKLLRSGRPQASAWGLHEKFIDIIFIFLTLDINIYQHAAYVFNDPKKLRKLLDMCGITNMHKLI